MPDPYSTDQQLRQSLTRQWTSVLPVLNAFVMSSVRDRQHAEDIIQEVGAAVSAHFTEIPEGVPFNRWVLGIARKQIHKRYRADQRDRHVFNADALDALAGAYDRLSDRTDEMRAALEHCVEQLPDRSRRVLELRYRQNQRVAGIADMLGSSANAISGVLFRVRHALRECFEKRLAEGETRA